MSATGQSNVLPLKKRSTFFSGSVRVWAGVVAFLAAAKLLIIFFFPNAFADPAQAAFFTWPVLAIFSVVGLAGVLLSERTGFPDAWSPRVSHVKRILLPLLVGMAWALIPIAVDRLTGYTQLVAERHGQVQQYTGFWQSLISFSAASVLVEVLYRLLIIPLVLFLVSNLIFKKKYQEIIFWIMAVLTSLLEPLSQSPDLSLAGSLGFPILFAQAFLFNFTQAAFFRRYGFLAAILLRVGFYFVWHTLDIH